MTSQQNLPEQYIDRIICGDSIDTMSQLPAKSIPLIVADPPYNIGKAEWDKIDNYLDWCGDWLRACERVLADNGSMYVFHNHKPTIWKLCQWIEDNTAFVFKNEITWCKINPLFRNYGFVQQRLSNGTMRNYYDGFTEYILYYTFQDETGLSRVYDDRDCFRGIKEYLRVERKKAGLSNEEVNSICEVRNTASRHFFSDSQWCLPTAEMYARLQTTGYFQRPYEELRMEYEELRYPFNMESVIADQFANSNVWYYMPVSDPQHPTQKPVELIENIILHSSNEGDLVLDPFSGSGTTAVAAIRTDHHYIGIDTSKEYCQIARERIAIENAQLKLDLTGGAS